MGIEVTKIADNLYEFNEGMDYGDGVIRPYVDSYLYIGKERAAVVDTLQNLTGLYELVRTITDLPIDVLITHGHLDHAGLATGEFADAGCKIYMDMRDIDILKGMVPSTKAEWFTDIKGGETFDLGGIVLEAISCPGHTPGSMVFVDREHQVLLSGDTLGSGALWMQIRGALPIGQYQKNVAAVYEQLKDLPDLLIYPGHRNQSPVQLTARYVKDVKDICDGIMDGSITGEYTELTAHGMEMKFYSVTYGQMQSFCYDPNNK